MALDANNTLLHIKRTLHSSVRLAFHSATEYPLALGVGMLLLFLHRLCPSLFALLLSSSPVFLLTALLLGALLSYGEPSAPVTREETQSPEDKRKPSPAVSRVSVAECSVVQDVHQNVAVVTHVSRSIFESPAVCAEETASDGVFHGAHRDEDGSVTSVSADTVCCAEASELAKNGVVVVEREEHVKEIRDKVEDFLQFFQGSAAEGASTEVGKTSEGVLLDAQCERGYATSMSTDSVLRAGSSGFDEDGGVVAEREEEEEHVKEIREQVEPPQQSESTVAGRCRYEVSNQYQFGELMSSCWKPVTRQEPCSDSESDDLTESSSDASITDIIPMLDELNPPGDLGLGTSHPSSAFRDSLNAAGSSDEHEDHSSSEEEDGNLSSDEEEEEKRDDESSWKGFVDPSCLDTDKNENSESLMARRKAKNVLKFELDRRLMEMQAADAVQKLEEASRFRVQVPYISTPRPDPSKDSSVDTVELPQVPDSAPSVLLPWRKPFDVPFDQIVDRGSSRLQETWTPRFSGFSSAAQGRIRDGLSVWPPSAYPRRYDGMKPEKTEFSGTDAGDDQSESESEEPVGNNGSKLFGSLEPHTGDEIKILSAAVSDVCVLEANHGTGEGTENTDDSINGADPLHIQKSVSSSSDVNDYSGSAGSNEQPALRSLPEEHDTDTEEHTIVEEEDSMSQVNSLFKCRMEEVLVQSVSEAGIGQPLTVQLERDLSDTSSHAEPVIVEARSAEEQLNSQFAQLNGGEALLARAEGCGGHCSDRLLGQGRPVAVKVVGGEGEGEAMEVVAEEMSSLFGQQLEGGAAGDGEAVILEDLGEVNSGTGR